MLSDIKLKRAAMAFSLQNGETLLISNDDVQEIANKLMLEMVLNQKHRVYMFKDTVIEKCNLLYKIVTEQKDKMTEDVRNEYFRTINKLILDTEEEEIPMEQDFKDKGINV